MGSMYVSEMRAEYMGIAGTGVCLRCTRGEDRYRPHTDAAAA